MNARSESSSPPAEAGRTAQAVALGLVLLTVSWGLLHAGFYRHNQIIDTPLYQQYGEKILDGQVPYRDFKLEYPPGALPVFALPALAAKEDYKTAFELLMWACAVATMVLLATAITAAGGTTGRLFAATAFLGLAPLALGSVILTRFDLWPAALAVGALAALAAGREWLGLGVLGAATATKLYPAVIVPVALIWVWRRSGPRAAAVALAVYLAVCTVIALPFALLSPSGFGHSLSQQLDRPLQIESLGSALLLAAHQLGLYRPTVDSTHGSQNLAGSLPDAIASVQTALQLIALVAVLILFARRQDADANHLFAGAAASVAAFVAFGKVLSPQFLIWLLPLVPLVAGELGLVACGVFATALVVTQLWFPYRYWHVVHLSSSGWLVLLRDLLLVLLFAVLAAATALRYAAPRNS
ncbi:MAG TPA: glycosyltransferase 87 family protein [Gaiellaceae bacterium]